VPLISHHLKSTHGKYRSITGTFRPIHPEKYLGSSLPKYKSMLEFRCFCFMDKSPYVISWNYESIAISYIDPTKRNMDGKIGRKRKYYIDVIADIKTRDGIKRTWIEVKSKRETIKPKKSTSRKSRKNIKLDEETWMRNQSKWAHARASGKKRGYEFIILTEDQLK